MITDQAVTMVREANQVPVQITDQVQDQAAKLLQHLQTQVQMVYRRGQTLRHMLSSSLETHMYTVVQALQTVLTVQDLHLHFTHSGVSTYHIQQTHSHTWEQPQISQSLSLVTLSSMQILTAQWVMQEFTSVTDRSYMPAQEEPVSRSQITIIEHLLRHVDYSANIFTGTAQNTGSNAGVFLT